jgi:UDP:flavonoid glycosyltransferase YjiC (YdhE family)
MAKILVVPLPEAGHILPTLGVARHLQRQGHAVTYLTAPSLRGWLAGSGAQLEPLISLDDGQEHVSGVHIWTLFADGDETKLRPIKLEAMLRRIQSRENYDFVLLDRLLARAHREELFHPSRVVLFSTSLPDWNTPEPSHPNLPTIIFCPESFEVPKFRHPYPRLHYVEPSVRPLDNCTIDFPDAKDDRPLALAAFGTQGVKDRRLAKKCLLVAELAERLPQFQFLLAAPAVLGDNLLPGPPPTNLTIVERAPQRQLLQRAFAFICHGGLGSIKEAILAGVPMIVLPALNDQPFNAMRVRFHGLGDAVFPEKQTVDAVEELVRNAVGGAFSTGLQRMQSQFLAMERAALSHVLIDSHLAGIENASRADSANGLHTATPPPSE